ncbi:DUF6082 family protein [Actinoplanes sp. NPDC000266]
MLTAMCALAFTAAMASVLVTPLVLGRLYAAGGDYSRLSDIGQAYGAASAMIAALTLGVVLAGLAVQRRQLRDDRLRALMDKTDVLVKLAMDEPVYRQCWGARIAPDGMDEDVFYYCNAIVNTWKQAWELRDLPEAQLRGYLERFFDSEVPRLFWRLHGDWHKRARPRISRGRRPPHSDGR